MTFSRESVSWGGGDLSLTAGGNMVDVSAVIPTTGRLLGAAGSTPSLANLLLTGGGNLRVQAGGNIESGVFEDDWGNATIAAGGSLSSGTTFGVEFPGTSAPALVTSYPIYPVLVVGNGVFDVSGRAGITLDAVTSSMIVPTSAGELQQLSTGSNTYFYTYAPTANSSTLNVQSTGGNIVLDNDAADLPQWYLIQSLPTAPNSFNYVFTTYPANVEVSALSGSIGFGDPNPAYSPSIVLDMYPSATGNLQLLAEGSILNDGKGFSVSMSESNPSLEPSALAAASSGSLVAADAVALPQQPLHQNDSQPIDVVAQTGSIDSGTLILPKAANVVAAGTISDLNYLGKNLNPFDVTLIETGGNITYSTPTTPVTNALEANGNGIDLAGPGYLEVLAGGSINLGDANGIVTSGSLSDSRLPTNGAALIAGAGFGANADGSLRQPAYQSFINTYLAPAANGTPSAYAADVVSFMQQLIPVANANLSASGALQAFKALTSAQQLPLIAQVLSDELSATGLAHTLHGASYAPGYAAINALFPTTDAQGKTLAYDGDINLAFSQLKTEQGGDIDLLAPGGSVIVGEPNPPATLAVIKQSSTASGLTIPAAVNLGILVLGQGAVNGFADESFDVNQSRILTLEGGDIILWASNGDIDAGKGAKSASGAPPPVIQTDANGNLFVDPSNAVSGSGIGQLLTIPGITAGLVNLIAPKGDVNAGDAGIRVAGNLNIAAVQVIGAGNITVVGTSTGVPVSEAGAFAGALSGANSLGDTSKNAVDQLTQDLGGAQNYQQLSDSLTPTFITVKMFCLGIECEQK
jgi:filamentous hemagglutinin